MSGHAKHCTNSYPSTSHLERLTYGRGPSLPTRGSPVQTASNRFQLSSPHSNNRLNEIGQCSASDAVVANWLQMMGPPLTLPGIRPTNLNASWILELCKHPGDKLANESVGVSFELEHCSFAKTTNKSQQTA